MPAVFSNYLKNIRQDKGLTQKEAIELLTKYDDEFSKLDLTTFSRWEKQKTSPSLARKILLLRGLGGNTLEILEPLLQSTQDKKSLTDILSTQSLDPYCLDKVRFTLKTYKSLLTEPKIEEKIKIFHNHFINMPIRLSDYFATQKVKLNVLTDDTGHLIGHSLYGFSPINNSFSNLDIKVLDNTLHTDESLLSKEKSLLNIISIYGSTPYSRMLNLMSILKVVRDHPKIKGVIATLHFHDAFSYFNNITSAQILETGEITDVGGVKCSGKNYRYVRILLRSEDLLASKALIEYIVHCDDYLDDLLITQEPK